MEELTLGKTLKRGSKGKKVKIVQEWLCLNNINLAIDSSFGPATEHAVLAFQKKNGLKPDSIVGPKTFASLTRPMADAVAPLKVNHTNLGRAVVACAKQHLKAGPREIGGQNRGPWVRLYMKGNEGNEWPWCAGFVSYVLAQSALAVGAEVPVVSTFSCDTLAASAKEGGIFLPGTKARKDARLKGGSIFLSRRTSTDWTHTGIVLSAGDEVFETIEGNTNDEGSREGYEVCQRIRGYAQKDFVIV